MPLVAAAILPHGFPLIPALDNGVVDIGRLRVAMERVGASFRDAGVESIVLAGPHGTRVEGAMAVVHTGRAAGALEYAGGRVEMNVPVDHALAEEIAARAIADGVPAALTGFGGNRMDQAVSPLDWGAITPLWFLGHHADRTGYGSATAASPDPADDGPPVVLITPGRSLPRAQHIAFGRSLGALLAGSDRRIGFVASCDWSHTHAESGPYGAHPVARQMDDTVQKAIRSNDLANLQHLPQQDVEAAAIDGLWQCLMLAGMQLRIPMRSELLAYGIDGYYSMIVASFQPE